jgi:hypothetical protein
MVAYTGHAYGRPEARRRYPNYGMGGGGAVVAPVAPVIADAQYVLWLRGEEADESQTITDSGYYNRACTPTGNVKNDTAQKYFGNGSLYFDGGGDYVTVAHNNTDFESTSSDTQTWQAWVRPTLTVTTDYIYGHYVDANNYLYIERNTTSYGVTLRIGGSVVLSLTATSSAVANTWTHVRLTRDGSAWDLSINGVSVDTGTSSATLSGNATIRVGTETGFSHWFGFIDDFAFIDGTALTYDPTLELAGPTVLNGQVVDGGVDVVDNGILVINS